MAGLEASRFAEYFRELHGYLPFPWQERLAHLVCDEGWPASIDLPTASGKTACIDIALFALAIQERNAPRRIFFVVDRRIIVNEAYTRARRISGKLSEALKADKEGILGDVARALCARAGSGGKAAPLEAYELRGGSYRDEGWVRSPLQPAVIASTVDHIGSRVLFRGYGISQESWPIYAGMIANDSLVLLDEAHCSKPFGQTLSAIERYRGPDWAETSLDRPFRFVEMTATPSRAVSKPFHISEEDRVHEVFRQRLFARKPTVLVEPVKGREDDAGKLADELTHQVTQLANAAGATRAAVIVNRVTTAKLVHQRLRSSGLDPLLVIGRMRPFDRDEVDYQPLKSDTERKEGDSLKYVVATQCLEVGADLDFDVLVSECASIDALLQRFGRLDRLGHFGRAQGRIVIGSWQTDPSKPDAVYDAALANTWNWLRGLASNNEVNMGIEAREGEPPSIAQREAQRRNGMEDGASDPLRIETALAPVLLPSHLDTFVQTSPVPEPSPAVELFLHGPDDRVADVQVIWRGDLDANNFGDWHEIVSMCPPVSREAIPVQIATLKRWLAKLPNANRDDSDLAGRDERFKRDGHSKDEDDGEPAGLIWRGESKEFHPGRDFVWTAAHVRPGDTVLLPVSRQGWEELGHIPDLAPRDIGDIARLDLKRRICLRLHPKLVELWPNDIPVSEEFRLFIGNQGWSVKEFCDKLVAFDDQFPPFLKPVLTLVPKLKRRELTPYPDGDGYVLEGWYPKEGAPQSGEVFLDVHAAAVEKVANATALNLIAPHLTEAVTAAATLHDHGKADVRFQAWLRRGDSFAARFARRPLAKSGVPRLGQQSESGLPKGFRHELLSLLFAAGCSNLEAVTRDLVLHLVASHHGRCRPFAPVVQDAAADCVEHAGVAICSRDRLEQAAHRLDSGVSERFWTLTRNYGWWGLAYLEALLRLADWEVSDATETEVMN